MTQMAKLSSNYKKVSVFAPASIGNVNVGFDLLGAAVAPIDGTLLGDIVHIEASDSEFILTNTGDFSKDLPNDLEQNLVYRCYQIFSEHLKQKKQSLLPMAVSLDKNMPIGSGLGSSACSVVAALVAYNRYHDDPFSIDELLMLMGEVEGSVSGSVHYDNVAPCYLGGIQLMLQYQNVIAQSIPAFDNWYWVMAYPGITVSTAEARAILPQTYSKSDLLAQNRYLATFIHACYTQQEQLAADMLIDRIAQPYRSQLLPNFENSIKETRAIGAIASGISGSGPTLFNICNDIKTAERVKVWLENHYVQNQQGFVHICKLSDGVSITVER